MGIRRLVTVTVEDGNTSLINFDLRDPPIGAVAASSAGLSDAAGTKVAGQGGTVDVGAPTAPNPSADGPLGVVDVVVGRGPEAKAGDKLRVHYTGTLTNGTEFDNSRKRNQPFEFQLGKGAVIKGWDQGVAGMKVGGKRKLTIPPGLGYGARGAGASIPPNSTLLFDVELVEIVGVTLTPGSHGSQPAREPTCSPGYVRRNDECVPL
jgi:hypothetical protein